MQTEKSQLLRNALTLFLLCISIQLSVLKHEVNAAPPSQTTIDNISEQESDVSDSRDTQVDQALIRQNAFNNAVKDFSEGDARLGNELASLPGPNISFNDLLRVIITWSASLAASVAIFIFVLRSFAAISGTEEAHNQWKSSILKILIGLVLIFFSYQIIAFVMGILWAT